MVELKGIIKEKDDRIALNKAPKSDFARKGRLKKQAKGSCSFSSKTPPPNMG